MDYIKVQFLVCSLVGGLGVGKTTWEKYLKEEGEEIKGQRDPARGRRREGGG